MTSAPRVSSAAVALAALFGCSEPSLRIIYSIEDRELADHVDRVTVELYLPGEPGFDCSALAFGAVAPTPILELDLDESALPATIPRVGTKLFVLRGFGQGRGEPSVAGCAEVETIEGEDEVRIVAEPVTIAVVEGASFGLTEDRSADFNRWQVQIQDLLDRPQPAVAVRWNAFGAGMQQPMTGEATVAPSESWPVISLPQEPAPGPLRMTVRSRWGLESSTALSFVPPRETRFALSGVKTDFAVVDSPRRRVLLSAVQTSTASEVSAFHPDGAGQIDRTSQTISGVWILGQTSAGTVLLSRGQARRVSVLDDGNLRLDPPAPFFPEQPAEPVEVIDLSGCDPALVEPLGAVTFADSGRQVFDAMFEPVSVTGLSDVGKIDASGCVPTRDGPEVRLLWSTGPPRSLWLLSGGGVQALPLDPRIVSLAFGGRWTDASNVAISTSVVDRTNQIALRPAVTVPDGLLAEAPETFLGAAAAMDAGDVDGNGALDLVVVTRIDEVRHALYIIVTGPDQGSAGAGLVLPGRFTEPWLAVIAFESERTPVIVVGDRRAGSAAEEHSLLFFRMER